MENNKNNHFRGQLSKKVLEKIQAGQVKIRSRFRFMLTHVLLVLGATVAMALVIFLLSFIIFAIRGTGTWYLSYYGPKGIWSFLAVFPWMIFIVAVVLLIVFEIFVKHFSYKRPLVYSAIAALILAMVFSWATLKVGLHSRLREYSQSSNLPVIGKMYRGFENGPVGHMVLGSIEELTEHGFILRTDRDERLEVEITEGTRFPFGKYLEEGFAVFVAGEREVNKIRAFGVHKIEEGTQRMFFRQPPMRGMKMQVPPPFMQ